MSRDVLPGCVFVLMLPLFLAPPVAAQAWPARPIRMIVPVAPGGGADITSRLVAQKLSERFGQQVVVDNRSGAGGIVGLEMLARATPDGYTISQGGVGPLAVNPSLYAKLPYDPLKDFAPILRAVSALNVLVVHPSVPVHSVKDLIAFARANPNKLNYGSSGAGRADHLAGELFSMMAGVRMQHVPYKGGGPAMTDLVGGNLQLIFATVSTAASHIKSGKIRTIANTSAVRSDLFPDLPTIAESGLPGFAIDNWYSFIAPAGTPASIIDTLNVEIARALALPDVKERLHGLGIVPFTTARPAEFAQYLRAEIAKYAKLVKAVGITPE
ncbi:MAG: tripartite tricarboxylate transporter substrate binding protein [Burkholderiales bacterium]|jgi:tripartite-type tricarboxylate transporter receptor subunit TctC|nr:tripartite tricarboxylate transporter substrate binding protein [Burkholderiales bacterium]